MHKRAILFSSFKRTLFTCHADLILCDRSSSRSLCYHSGSLTIASVHGQVKIHMAFSLIKKKKKSCMRDEKKIQLWSYGTTIHNLLFRCLCNLSSRQSIHTVVAALGRGYQETHKSWRGLKAMSIHPLTS